MPTSRIVWCSPSYGYGADLMYFAPIFRSFCKEFPDTSVPVSVDFPVKDYSDLPLLPILSFVRPRRSMFWFWSRGSCNTHWPRPIPTPASLVRLARLQADLYIVIEFTPLALAACALAALRRKRVLLLLESDPRLRGAHGGRLQTAVKSFVARRATHVLVSNEEGAAFATKELRVPGARLTVGPYLTSEPPKDGALDGRCRVREDGQDSVVRLLYLNSVSPMKGLGNLLTALAEMNPDTAGRWTLDVVGTGRSFDEARRQARDLRLGDSVTFYGAVPHSAVWSHYATADVVISPTLGDYRSIGSFEAVNAGRPAVLSCYDGAAAEIKRSGAAVHVVRPDEPGALSAILARFVMDRAFLASAREAARVPPPQFSLAAISANIRVAALAALGERRAGHR